MAAAGYSQGCLIGNWQEDRVIDNQRLQDYAAKRDNGALSIKRTQMRLGPQLASVPLELPASDAPPHYGETVLLQACASKGLLAFSLGDKPLALEGEHAGLFCAAPSIGPAERTVFKLVSYDGKQGPVRYDDKVAFESASSLFKHESRAFVCSEVPPLGSQASDQGVTLSLGHGSSIPYSAAFTVLPADMTARLGLLGQPVSRDQPFVLVHCRSGRRLSGVDEDVNTDFGMEKVVTMGTAVAKGVVHQLHGEQMGTRPLTGYGVKQEEIENHWRLV